MTRSQFQSALGALNDVGATWYAVMTAAMDRAQINTPLRQAHFLAQVGHESLSLTHLKELYSGPSRDAYFENKYGVGHHKNAILMGNTEPGDGAKYFGRGPIQCTWKANYREFGHWAGIDAVGNPDLLLKPEHGANFCAWFWIANGLNRFCDTDDLRAITKKINGGTNGLEDRRARLVIAKQALGIWAGNAPTAP